MGYRERPRTTGNDCSDARIVSNPTNDHQAGADAGGLSRAKPEGYQRNSGRTEPGKGIAYENGIAYRIFVRAGAIDSRYVWQTQDAHQKHPQMGVVRRADQRHCTVRLFVDSTHSINRQEQIRHDDIEAGDTLQNFSLLRHRAWHSVFHRSENHQEKRKNRLPRVYPWHRILRAGHSF